jgi:hypothetical protein
LVLIVNRISREFVIESEGAAPLSIAELAGLLRSFEDELTRDQPERVVLADDSDRALAAALVAAKLLIPIEAKAGASGAASANARVISQLASA